MTPTNIDAQELVRLVTEEDGITDLDRDTIELLVGYLHSELDWIEGGN